MFVFDLQIIIISAGVRGSCAVHTNGAHPRTDAGRDSRGGQIGSA